MVCKLFKFCLKQVCSDAFFVHINGVNSRLIRRKCLERAKIAWALTDNIVPWVKKDATQKIKRLLRTRSQNHLVRISLDALSGQNLADSPSALNTAIRVAVLKRPKSLNSNAASSALCNLIKRQRRNVWQTTRQRNNTWTRQGRKQISYFALSHGLNAICVKITPYVKRDSAIIHRTLTPYKPSLDKIVPKRCAYCFRT